MDIPQFFRINLTLWEFYYIKCADTPKNLNISLVSKLNSYTSCEVNEEIMISHLTTEGHQRLAWKNSDRLKKLSV